MNEVVDALIGEPVTKSLIVIAAKIAIQIKMSPIKFLLILYLASADFLLHIIFYFIPFFRD